MRHYWMSLPVFFLTAALLAGCSATRGPAAMKPLTLEGSTLPLEAGTIVKTATGEAISLEALLDELAQAQVVYVGEMHTSIEDHRVQMKILQGLYSRNPSVILALEMLPREAQAALSRYAAGEIDEEVFLKESNWEGVWGYTYRYYRALLSFAREKRLELVALNAHPEVVRKIARGGLASLAPEERDRVARDFHLDNAEHREYVRKEYEQHLKGDILDFQAFYEGQLAWEETMAETLVKTIAETSPGRPVVALIGKGHITGHVGVPRLARERFDHELKTVVPVPVNYPERTIEAGIGDYVWVTERAEPFHRGRLGIMIRPPTPESGVEELEVAGVVPESPAEKAGVKQGDILTMMDGTPIKSLDELHRAVAKGAPQHRLTLRRGGEEITVTVTISE